MKRIETLPVLTLDVIRPFGGRDELVFGFHEETGKGLEEGFDLGKGLRSLLRELVECDSSG